MSIQTATDMTNKVASDTLKAIDDEIAAHSRRIDELEQAKAALLHVIPPRAVQPAPPPSQSPAADYAPASNFIPAKQAERQGRRDVLKEAMRRVDNDPDAA